MLETFEFTHDRMARGECGKSVPEKDLLAIQQLVRGVLPFRAHAVRSSRVRGNASSLELSSPHIGRENKGLTSTQENVLPDARNAYAELRRLLGDRSRLHSMDFGLLLGLGIGAGVLIFLFLCGLCKAAGKPDKTEKFTRELEELAWEKQQDRLWAEWEKNR